MSRCHSTWHSDTVRNHATFFQERRYWRPFRNDRRHQRFGKPATRSDQDLKRWEDLSMSRCHSTWHIDRSRVPDAISTKENWRCVESVNEDTKDAEDRPQGRIKTKKGGRTFSWDGITLRDKTTNESIKRHYFKKKDNVDHFRVKKDTKDAEDQPPGRIKTKKGGRTFSWVGVTSRNTATHESTNRHF